MALVGEDHCLICLEFSLSATNKDWLKLQYFNYMSGYAELQFCTCHVLGMFISLFY